MKFASLTPAVYNIPVLPDVYILNDKIFSSLVYMESYNKIYRVLNISFTEEVTAKVSPMSLHLSRVDLGGTRGTWPPRCSTLCNVTLKQHNVMSYTAIKNAINGIKLCLSFSPAGLKFQVVYFKKCSSFWGTPSPDSLPGLRPWTPLGDRSPSVGSSGFRPQTP